MHRDADGTGLIGNGAGNGLPDPPGGVGGKLKALGVVEFFHRLDKAQIALLDEIQELHAAAHIPLGNGNHQTQICLGKPLFGGHIALRHPDGQLDLLLGGKQRHPADLLEVHLYRVIDADAVGAQHALQLLIAGRGYALAAVVLHDLDIVRLEGIIQLVHLFHIVVQLLQRVADLLSGQAALLLTAFQQLLEYLFFILCRHLLLLLMGKAPLRY